MTRLCNVCEACCGSESRHPTNSSSERIATAKSQTKGKFLKLHLQIMGTTRRTSVEVDDTDSVESLMDKVPHKTGETIIS